jgi:hypothetical protein
LYYLLLLLANLRLAYLHRLAHLLKVGSKFLDLLQIDYSGLLEAFSHLIPGICFRRSHPSFQLTDQEVLSFQLCLQGSNGVLVGCSISPQCSCYLVGEFFLPYDLSFCQDFKPFSHCARFLIRFLLHYDLPFLSKKNSLGGNSSTEMGVSSSLKIHPASGFPFVNCKGVIEAMGLSISLNDCFGIASVAGLLDMSDSESPNPCEGISA